MSSFQKEKDEVCKELEKVDGQIEAWLEFSNYKCNFKTYNLIPQKT